MESAMSTPPSEPGDLTLDSCYPLVKRYTRDELPQPLTASIRDGKEPQLIGPGRQRGRHRLGQRAPLRFGQKGAATRPRMKNRPTIVAARPYPPRLTIRPPAINGRRMK